MIRVEKKVPDAFLKIVPYMSEEFLDLNKSIPYYGHSNVGVISITPVGTDKDGNPLFCYELKDEDY